MHSSSFVLFPEDQNFLIAGQNGLAWCAVAVFCIGTGERASPKKQHCTGTMPACPERILRR